MTTETPTRFRLDAVIRTSENATTTLDEFRVSMQHGWSKGFLSDYNRISDYVAVEARAKVWAMAARYAKSTSPSAGDDLLEMALVCAMDNGHSSSEIANAYAAIERKAWRDVYVLLADRAY